MSLTNIVEILYKKYHFTKALDHYNQGLEILPKLFPNGHAYTAHGLKQIGMIYERIQNSDTALQYYEKTLDIYQNIFPANHPETIKMNARIVNVVPLILSPSKQCFLINKTD